MSGRKVKKQKKFIKQKQKAELKKSIKTVGCDFPFLCDGTTIRYIMKSKVMFVMRGLPGSGKSTISHLLEKVYKKAVTCSADDYFLESDKYEFDATQLQEAHQSCFDKATSAAENKKCPIIIDNTHVRRWEMSKYFTLANDNNYVVVVVLPKTSWRFDADRLAELNKHQVPTEELQKKLKDFQEVLPIYFGWFLNEFDSERLVAKADEMFDLCLKSFPEFSRYLREHVALKDGQKLTFREVFVRNSNKPPMLHCTSMFAGYKKKSPAAVEYAQREGVEESIGKCFNLRISGIILTPRTIGCRVILNDHQLQLWANDTDAPVEDVASATQTSPKAHVTQITKDIHITDEDTSLESQELSRDAPTATQNPFEVVQATKTTSDDTLDKHDKANAKESHERPDQDYTVGTGAEHGDSAKEMCSSKHTVESAAEVLYNEVSHVNMSSSDIKCCNGHDGASVELPMGSKAHMTLGYVESSEAVQTGFDQLDVLTCAEEKKRIGSPVHVDDLTISYYGEGRCMVEFSKHIYCNSLFSGGY